MDLVKKAKELFPKRKENDALGISSSPIELKVLALLKVLGRGVCHDNCADCISIPQILPSVCKEVLLYLR